jgi:lipoic acid synthetase
MVGLNNPMGVNAGEPQNIARMVSDLKLKHVVLTSVTRDDLKDEGAGQFAATINCIKSLMVSSVTIEVLTPDFHAREDCLKTVCKAGPNIFNHNIETVRRLTPIIRSNADYDRSMDVLRWVSKNGLGIVVKSGLMTGLGETREEIMETLKDLKNAGCQIVTIGQYLQPRKENIGVQRYLSDEEFKELKEKGEDLGIKKVFSGPFVRSSYMAETQILNSKH